MARALKKVVPIVPKKKGMFFAGVEECREKRKNVRFVFGKGNEPLFCSFFNNKANISIGATPRGVKVADKGKPWKKKAGSRKRNGEKSYGVAGRSLRFGVNGI